MPLVRNHARSILPPLWKWHARWAHQARAHRLNGSCLVISTGFKRPIATAANMNHLLHIYYWATCLNATPLRFCYPSTFQQHQQTSESAMFDSVGNHRSLVLSTKSRLKALPKQINRICKLPSVRKQHKENRRNCRKVPKLILPLCCPTFLKRIIFHTWLQWLNTWNILPFLFCRNW